MEVNLIKIVIVSPDNPFVKIKVGGKHIHILNFYKALQLKGFDVNIITFKKNISKINPLALLSYAKFKLFGTKTSFKETQNSRFNFFIKTIEEDITKKIKKFLINNKSEEIFFVAEDVVAIHAIYRAGVDSNHTFSVLHGYFTYEAVDIGSIIENEKDLRYFYEYEKRGYSYCSKIVTVDSAIKNYLIKEMDVSPQKINVIYNAIDIKEFEIDLNEKLNYKQLFFEDYGLKEANNLILIARRLVNKNGVYYGVKSMSDLRKISREIYNSTLMVICGDGPEKTTIRQLIEKENLGSNILLFGQVDYDKIKNIYKAADVVIVPSIFTETKFAEATSLAALEAMASRSVVIVTNVGGLKEIVENKFTGFVVEEKNSRKIAETLEIIFDLNQKDEINAIKNQAFQYVIREHHYKKHLEKILNFFSIK